MMQSVRGIEWTSHTKKDVSKVPLPSFLALSESFMLFAGLQLVPRPGVFTVFDITLISFGRELCAIPLKI